MLTAASVLPCATAASPIAICLIVSSHDGSHCHNTCTCQQRLWVQGLLGPQICQQLGQEAIDSAVTQTAGLLPRDLQALAADAAAAAAARGLNTSHMLPHVRAPQAPNVHKLLQEEPQSQAGPVSIWGKEDNRQLEGPKRQLEGGEGDSEGQQAGLDGQDDSKEIVQVSGADVQGSLDRVRLRTATVIGAPKVSQDVTLQPTIAHLLGSPPLSTCSMQDHAVLLPDCAHML